MKIRFVVDYAGRETAMRAYRAGDEVELHHPAALELIRLGVAIPAEQVFEEEKPKARTRGRAKQEADDGENT